MKYKILIFPIIIIILFQIIFLSGCTSEKTIYFSNYREYTNFLNQMLTIESKYSYDINDLGQKFNSTDNIDKKKAYSELIVEEYDKWLNEIRDIKTPSYALPLFNTYMDMQITQKRFYQLYVYSTLDDVGELNILKDECIRLNNEFKKQLDLTNESFNQEARELGLQEPF